MNAPTNVIAPALPLAPANQTLADTALSQPIINGIPDLYYLELRQEKLDRQKRKSKTKKNKIGNPRRHLTMDDYFGGPDTYNPGNSELCQSLVTKATDKPSKGINENTTPGPSTTHRGSTCMENQEAKTNGEESTQQDLASLTDELYHFAQKALMQLRMKRDFESSPSSGKRIPTSSKAKSTDQKSEPKGLPDLIENIKQNRDNHSPKQQVRKRRTDDAEDKGRRKSPKST